MGAPWRTHAAAWLRTACGDATRARVVVTWARDIGADRVDLSATPEGERVYELAGFRRASAPRLKLAL